MKDYIVEERAIYAAAPWKEYFRDCRLGTVDETAYFLAARRIEAGDTALAAELAAKAAARRGGAS